MKTDWESNGNHFNPKSKTQNPIQPKVQPKVQKTKSSKKKTFIHRHSIEITFYSGFSQQMKHPNNFITSS